MPAFCLSTPDSLSLLDPCAIKVFWSIFNREGIPIQGVLRPKWYNLSDQPPHGDLQRIIIEIVYRANLAVNGTYLILLPPQEPKNQCLDTR